MNTLSFRKLIFARMDLKSLYRKIALSLATIMLMSSIGFSIDFHFCKGEFKSLSIYGQAESCHSAKKTCIHHPESAVNIQKSENCCSNSNLKFENLKSGIELVSSSLHVEKQLKVVWTFTSIVPSAYIPSLVKLTTCIWVAPRFSRDIYALFESFLL